MAIIITKHAGVTEISLGWPERRNALGPSEGRELRLALDAAVNAEDTAAVVLTAQGKAFCAGGNLPEIVRLATGGATEVRQTIYGEFQGIFRALQESPVPVISAVDGPAIGFGCDLALACNVTLVGDRGWLAQGWIKAGLIPATGGTLYAARRGGEQAVWRLLTTDKVDGPTAEQWGLAIACTNARESALAMARKLSELPSKPLRAMARLAKISEQSTHLDAALEYQIGFITDPAFPDSVKALLQR